MPVPPAIDSAERIGRAGWRRARQLWRRITERMARPSIEGLEGKVVRRDTEIVRLKGELSAARPEGTEPFFAYASPGHYLSPIPSMPEIEADASRIWPEVPSALPGLPLDPEEILRTFETIASAAKKVVLASGPTADRRYHTANDVYGPGDALTLAGMMLTFQPKRYVEIGSGWSTAMALDVNEHYLGGTVEFTCVEPYPERLRQLIRDGDRVQVIDRFVQSMPTQFVEQLEPNDFLFIDCSHVLKIGSDVHHIITQVLPRVPAGVHVHIHDMFWPFEYPRVWVDEGRAWTECYAVHAFLLHNHSYRIELFNDWLAATNRDKIKSALPAMEANPGGALWLERTSTA